MLPLIEPSRHGRVASGAVQVAERVGFDDVAKHGAGAVGLDERDVPGGGAGAVKRAQHDLGLRPAVGSGDAVALAVLVGGAPDDDRVDRLAVS